jgi:murein DD-endopeptidase MepM/ murein hydrolase activator NlpD
MGSYNSQYESYYNGMLNKRRTNNPSSSSFHVKIIPDFNKKYFARRIIVDLVGVLFLIILVSLCKLIATPKTTAVYNFSKTMVATNYDYKVLFTKVKSINLKATSDDAINFIETMKTKIIGGKTWKNKIKEEFMLPIEGKLISGFGEKEDPLAPGKKIMNYGVDIDAKEGTEVLASYDGVIKDLGEDKQLGKYVLIDNGSSIETKYGHLSAVSVKKGDNIKKAQAIGKSGNTGVTAAPKVHYEILYMGENLNPEDYFSFKK